MLTRSCNACREEKSIAGVWYLVPATRAMAPAQFLCEACHVRTHVARSRHVVAAQ